MSQQSRNLMDSGWRCIFRVRCVAQKPRVLAMCLAVLLVLSPVHIGSLSADWGDGSVINAWCLQTMNVPNAPVPAGEQVRIALIDSGCSIDAGWLEAGRIAPGHNYVFETADTADLIGHGTQVASIILGADTATGELAGCGQQATVVPLVWISKYASGVLANGGVEALTAAIKDAVDIHHCRVISVSSGVTRDEPMLKEAIAYAEERGAVVVAAAGNSNIFAPKVVYYPAAYESVVGVGSVGSELQISAWSQRNQSVMLTAPGEGVYALAKERLLRVSGTSFSAAHVTAAIARLLSCYPELTSADVRSLLQRSARDMGDAGYDTSYGYGVLDLGYCLELAAELTSGIK